MSKILILIVLYRRHIEREALVNDILDWKVCLTDLKAVACFGDIKKNSLPHLKDEIEHYSYEILKLAEASAFSADAIETWTFLN